MIPAHYTESKMSPVTQGVLSSGATKKFDQSELDHRPAPAAAGRLKMQPMPVCVGRAPRPLRS
jgi:hypothetical protein